jgi:hypothetical protein
MEGEERDIDVRLVALDTMEQTLDESIVHAEGRIDHKTSVRGGVGDRTQVCYR